MSFLIPDLNIWFFKFSSSQSKKIWNDWKSSFLMNLVVSKNSSESVCQSFLDKIISKLGMDDVIANEESEDIKLIAFRKVIVSDCLASTNVLRSRLCDDSQQPLTCSNLIFILVDRFQQAWCRTDSRNMKMPTPGANVSGWDGVEALNGERKRIRDNKKMNCWQMRGRLKIDMANKKDNFIMEHNPT